MRDEIIYQDNKIVVRINVSKEDNEAFVTVNPVRDGKEIFPAAYMMGLNCLVYKIKS